MFLTRKGLKDKDKPIGFYISKFAKQHFCSRTPTAFVRVQKQEAKRSNKDCVLSSR